MVAAGSEPLQSEQFVLSQRLLHCGSPRNVRITPKRTF
jgi:hypothetical protein